MPPEATTERSGIPHVPRFLPFASVQTPEHYAFHALYAVAQVPLLGICVSWWRDHPHGSAGRRVDPPPPPGQPFR